MLFAHSLVLNVQKPHSKRCKNQGAMAPLAVFAFRSNSCEIDVHQTLSVLNWDNRRNKCQNHSYLCLFQCATIFLVHSNGSSGFQAFNLKGHRKSKGRLFKHLHMPNESKSSQHIMKGFTSSSSGTSGKDRNVHPYHSSRKCDSSAKRQHGYFMSYN